MINKRIPSNRTNFNKERPVSERVADVLSKNYIALKARLCIGGAGNYMSMSYEDMFHNAILFTIQDAKADELTTDNQILKYFEYKYKCVVMEIIKDSYLIKNTAYADYQQTQEDEKE